MQDKSAINDKCIGSLTGMSARNASRRSCGHTFLHSRITASESRGPVRKRSRSTTGRSMERGGSKEGRPGRYLLITRGRHVGAQPRCKVPQRLFVTCLDLSLPATTTLPNPRLPHNLSTVCHNDQGNHPEIHCTSPSMLTPSATLLDLEHEEE